MIVLGVDPSSSCTGFAEVVEGELTDHAVWTPPTRATKPAALRDYEDSFAEWLGDRPVDLAVMLLLSNARGLHVVRAISRYEGPTLIVLERRGIPTIEVKDGEARNWALGLKITSKKEEAQEEIMRRYPDIKVPPLDRGGGDVIDAYVAALAAPEALRRLKR